MPINVGGKLWLAFFCTLSLVVLTMYLLLHGSLQRGFMDYTSQQAVQRLEILQDALVSIHREDGSFEELKQDPSRWYELKSIIFSEDARPVPAIRSDDQPDRSRESYYREFVLGISLFDANRRLLLGSTAPDEALSWAPVVKDGLTLGYIGFVVPEVVVRDSDRRFMRHQLTVFSIISLVILIISIGVATLLARRISRPIKALSQHTEALASGNYEQRIVSRSRDEIGQLCNNFNRLAQTLEANEKSRANWIADISHEMRTPVSVLKAQIEAMQDGVRPLDQKGLAVLAQKVAGLEGLVDDLFELTLSDIGALSYQKEPLALERLTALCVEQYQPQARDAGLTLRAILPEQAPVVVDGDPKRLDQLLGNLLENAIRYTDPGGAIEVELVESAQRVTLLVRDSTPTVAPEQRDKIFERLHRLEGSRNRSTGGAGLGLAICANIVAAHQGTINAEDSPLGGLTIRINLPKKPR